MGAQDHTGQYVPAVARAEDLAGTIDPHLFDIRIVHQSLQRAEPSYSIKDLFVERFSIIYTWEVAGLHTMFVVNEHFFNQSLHTRCTRTRGVNTALPDKFSNLVFDDSQRPSHTDLIPASLDKRPTALTRPPTTAAKSRIAAPTSEFGRSSAKEEPLVTALANS